MIYSRSRVAARQAQQAAPLMQVGQAQTLEQPELAEPFDRAMQILNDVGARTWRAEDETWCVSIPRRHEGREGLQWALEQLEEAAGRPAVVIWSRRKG